MKRLTRRDCLRGLSAGAGCLAALVGLAGCGGGEAAWNDLSVKPSLPRVLWGDVHTHTILSDGNCTLDELLTYARDTARLDFIIVTDHDFGHQAPWRMPQSDWNLVQDKVEQYTVPGRFVAIAGYEWTSQAKYWTQVPPPELSEKLYPGPPKYYNHKCAYFPRRVNYLFSAKDAAYKTPDGLAEAVAGCGGLVHNAHPFLNADCRDQWEYQRRHDAVIANTEMLPDVMRYQGRVCKIGGEKAVNQLLAAGGRCGFVGGSDTHECKPEARTAVLANELTREAIFDALRRRRNYGVSHQPIRLDFRIDGRTMGEEIESPGQPILSLSVIGTAPLQKVAVIRDGAVLASRKTRAQEAHWELTDKSFRTSSYYYLRVTQSDRDEHGNPSIAWSSPIWVRRK